MARGKKRLSLVRDVVVTRDDYFRFGFYLQKQPNQNFEKKIETEPKPVQTNRFWFGSVFYEKNPKKQKPKISNAISLKYILNHNTISTVALHLKKQPRYLQEINHFNRLSI